MFVVFCVLQCVVVGFAWTVLIWLWIARPRMLEYSSYPLFDFAVKTRFSGDDATIARATGNRAVRKALRTAKVAPVDMYWSNEIKDQSAGHAVTI